MKVRNLYGTARPQYKCRCGNWLKHGDNYNGACRYIVIGGKLNFI